MGARRCCVRGSVQPRTPRRGTTTPGVLAKPSRFTVALRGELPDRGRPTYNN